MRCVYCHDDWDGGIRCVCGATYHPECYWGAPRCATLGCLGRRQRKPSRIVIAYRRFDIWLTAFIDSLDLVRWGKAFAAAVIMWALAMILAFA